MKSKTVKDLASDTEETLEKPDLDKTMDFLTVDFKPQPVVLTRTQRAKRRNQRKK